MAINREALYAALFARLKAKIPGLKHVSRRFKSFADVPAQPAMILVSTEQTPDIQDRLPPKWALGALVIFYVRTQDTDQSPETTINEMIHALESALEWQREDGGAPQPYTTLGGKCIRCEISGSIELDQGTDGGQAVATIPVQISAA